jgi:intein/homing endonuclease
MAKRWTIKQEQAHHKRLEYLYNSKNYSIREISKLLKLSQGGVYDRLLRLKIKTQRKKKLKYNNRNIKVKIPTNFSEELAEFVGILLGDGHLTSTQITVCLGTKENEYVNYVAELMWRLFGSRGKITASEKGGQVVYLGSTALVCWFLNMGLTHNKVKFQVDIPRWCLSKEEYMRSVLRGLIDTDGSIYRLRSGMQISFCNRSKPMLQSVRLMLLKLGFNPSRVSDKNVYLTRKAEVARYVNEIGFSNIKHEIRFRKFSQHGRFV